VQKGCTNCGNLKPKSEYRLNPMTGRYSARCASCPPARRHSKYDSVESYLKHRYLDAKRRATGGGYAAECFTLAHLLELLEKQDGRCAVTRKVFTFGGDGAGTNVSIDRIDSNKPYSANNVRLVCSAVNYMKHRMNDDELVDWCLDIVKGVGPWK
jgi:hypothetical protein